MRCTVCGITFVSGKYCPNCGNQSTPIADRLSVGRDVSIGKVTAVGKCDCGAEKCRTTHARWCSTLKVEVALTPSPAQPSLRCPPQNPIRSAQVLEETHRPVWKDILAHLVVQGSISREVAARVIISGLDELQTAGNTAAILDLLEARIKVAERAMVVDQARLAAEWDGAALERKYAAKVPKDAQVLISAADYAKWRSGC